jgi:hypothetical protein
VRACWQATASTRILAPFFQKKGEKEAKKGIKRQNFVEVSQFAVLKTQTIHNP